MVMSIPDPGGFAKTIVAFQHLDALCVLGKEAIISRLLKKATFSPSQPWRAKTRLVPGKAAASEDRRRTLWGTLRI